MIFSKAKDSSLPSAFPPLFLNGSIIEKVETFKYLGVVLDSNLSFKAHCQHIENKTVAAKARLLSIKRLLPFHMFRTCFFAYVMSISDFCLAIWGFSKNSSYNIQKHMNRLLYLYLFPSLSRKLNKRKIPSSALWTTMDIHPLYERYHIACIKLVYDYLIAADNINWPYPKDWFLPTTSKRKTLLLTVSRKNSKASENSISASCVRLWNLLPRDFDFYGWTRTEFFRILNEHLVSKRNSTFI